MEPIAIQYDTLTRTNPNALEEPLLCKNDTILDYTLAEKPFVYVALDTNSSISSEIRVKQIINRLMKNGYEAKVGLLTNSYKIELNGIFVTKKGAFTSSNDVQQIELLLKETNLPLSFVNKLETSYN